MDLSVELAPGHKKGLWLKNPVMTAAGTFGYGVEYAPIFDIQELGAIVCKGTTLKPRGGNAEPRLAETPAGLLNAIGLQNVGVEAVIKEKAPIWAKWQVPVIVNIAGESVEEYIQVAAKLEGVSGVSAIEVNISCPNVATGGAEFGASPQKAAEITAAVKAATSFPVIVKLTPNVTDIVEVAQAVAEAKADALTLVNTLKGMAIDITTRRPFLGNVSGGLSGPAIKPVALYMVYKVAGVVKIPLIGCGGIVSAEDALEFIMAGASAVQIGTANFINPFAAIEVVEGIKHFMEKKKIRCLRELIGVAHSDRTMQAGI